MRVKPVEFDRVGLYLKARQENNPQLIIDALPYAKLLGMEAMEQNGRFIYRLLPKVGNIGNPTLPALHGGAIGGFMEMSAIIHLMMTMDHSKFAGGLPVFPKIVNFSVDYLRAARYEDSYARCNMVRQGKKLANVAVTLWQQDPDVPTATSRSHFLLESVA